MSRSTLCVVSVILLLAGLQWIIAEPPPMALNAVGTLPSPLSDSDPNDQHPDLYLQSDKFVCDGLFLLSHLLPSVDPGNPNIPATPNRIPRSPPTA